MEYIRLFESLVIATLGTAAYYLLLAFVAGLLKNSPLFDDTIPIFVLVDAVLNFGYCVLAGMSGASLAAMCLVPIGTAACLIGVDLASVLVLLIAYPFVLLGRAVEKSAKRLRNNHQA